MAPAAGPGDSSHYLPLTAGSAYNFDVSTGQIGAVIATNSGFAQLAVVGPATINGASGTQFLWTGFYTAPASSWNTYFAVSGGGITLLQSDVTTEEIFSPELDPQVLLTFPLADGTVDTIVATNVTINPGGANPSVLANFTQTNSVNTVGDYTTTAGTFHNVVELNMSLSGSESNGQQLLQASRSTWLAPGVGMVAEYRSWAGPGLINNYRGVQLRGYTIDAVAHGLGNPQLVAHGAWQFAPDNQAGYSDFSDARPAIATDGTNFLIVTKTVTGFAFGSSNAAQVNWLLTLAAADGSVISSQPLLSAAIAGTGQERLLVAYDGTDYEIVYESLPGALNPAQNPFTYDINVLKLSTNLTVVNPTPQLLESDAQLRGIALGGSNVLVVFNTFPSAMLSAQQFSTAFAPTGAPLQVSTAVGDAAAAFDGTNFAVAGADGVSLKLWRISTANALLDPLGISIVSTTPANQSNPGDPGVAFDGSNYLVVWEDARNNLSSRASNVFATRVSPQGVVLDGTTASPGFALTSSNVVQVDPTAFVENGEFFVTWSQYNNNGATGTPSGVLIVYGARVSSSGTVIHLTASGSLVSNGAYSGGDGLSFGPNYSGFFAPVGAATQKGALLIFLGSSNSYLASPTPDGEVYVVTLNAFAQ